MEKEYERRERERKESSFDVKVLNKMCAITALLSKTENMYLTLQITFSWSSSCCSVGYCFFFSNHPYYLRMWYSHLRVEVINIVTTAEDTAYHSLYVCLSLLHSLCLSLFFICWKMLVIIMSTFITNFLCSAPSRWFLFNMLPGFEWLLLDQHC